MSINNMDRHWDEIAGLIDKITRLRADRCSLHTQMKRVHTTLLATTWEVDMRRSIPAAARSKAPCAVIYQFAARHRHKS